MAKPTVLFTLIVVLAAALRIYSAIASGVPNSDAAYYIDHARIIYYGLWDAAAHRDNLVFSLYPFFIAAVYPFTGNWIVAAYTVSLVTGILLLFPIYRLAKRYLYLDTALLVTLTFAVLPTLVFAGAQILRDPIFWLFSAYGLLTFVETPHKAAPYSAVSSLLFLLASLNRQEGIVFFLVSLVFLTLRRSEKRLGRIAYFLLPWVIRGGRAAFALPASFVAKGFSRWHLWGQLMPLLATYKSIAAAIKTLAQTPPPPVPPEFFNFASTLLWLFPLGIIAYCALEAFHYLFLVVIILGITKTNKGGLPTEDQRYFVALSAAVFVMFYLYVLTHWEIEHRWLIALLLPAAVFLGQGYERILGFIVKKYRIARATAALILALVTVAVTLPRDLSPRELDKVVYKKIGMAIAAREQGDREIPILTAGVGKHREKLASFEMALRAAGIAEYNLVRV
ncbi:MAG: glycosyltransferase family 39 protein, partial [Syntrophales bacterium]|nr:glycosyltransferase family 39 protein [Syntrophales bacterium]